MKPNETGTDPVAMLYGRFIGDLFMLLDVERDYRLILPAIAEGQEYTAKDCWGLFDSMILNYRWALGHFDESVKIYREATLQPDVAELIGRTRATQGRRPYIVDAKEYLDKLRNLLLRLLEELVSNTPKRKTVKAYYAKEDQCKAIFSKFGFTIEEIERMPGLIDCLRTEFAIIDKDRKPTFFAMPQNNTKEQQAKVETSFQPRKKPGRKPAEWTQEEKNIIELNRQGMKPQEIASKLGLPNKRTTNLIRALKKRIKDGNPPS